LIEKLKQLARQPLTHFLRIGTAIYGLYGIFGGGEESGSERQIV